MLRVRRGWLAAGGLAGVLALGAGALAGDRVVAELFPSGGAPEADAGEPGRGPSLVRLFRDERAGFSLSYPASWRRLGSSDPQVRLVVARGSEASLLVRVVPLGFEIAPDEIADARALTERFVTRGGDVTMLARPERITLGGLPGWWYLYAFEDAETGGRGAHSHYFVFDGETMVVLVFQALPAERFSDFAPAFDRIAGSFRRG